MISKSTLAKHYHRSSRDWQLPHGWWIAPAALLGGLIIGGTAAVMAFGQDDPLPVPPELLGDNRWVARICINRKDVHLGYHVRLEDALAAYAKASKEFHGEFGRLG